MLGQPLVLVHVLPDESALDSGVEEGLVVTQGGTGPGGWVGGQHGQALDEGHGEVQCG